MEFLRPKITKIVHLRVDRCKISNPENISQKVEWEPWKVYRLKNAAQARQLIEPKWGEAPSGKEQTRQTAFDDDDCTEDGPKIICFYFITTKMCLFRYCISFIFIHSASATDRDLLDLGYRYSIFYPTKIIYLLFFV